MDNYTLLNIKEAQALAKIERSAFLKRIKDGYLCKGINLGGNTVVYVAEEIEAIHAAYAVGSTPEQVKQLVEQLHRKRKAAANDLLQSLKVAG